MVSYEQRKGDIMQHDRSKTVLVGIVLDGVLEGQIEMGSGGAGGAFASVSANNAVRPNFMIGFLALALDAMLSRYENEGRLQEHWLMMKDVVFDALEANEDAVYNELKADGIIDDSELR